MVNRQVLPPNPPPSIHVHLRHDELGHDAQDFKASNPLKDSMELKTSRLPASRLPLTELKECDDSGESA